MDEITKAKIQLTLASMFAICMLWFGIATACFMATHTKANQYAVFGHFTDVMTFSADVQEYK